MIYSKSGVEKKSVLLVKFLRLFFIDVAWRDPMQLVDTVMELVNGIQKSFLNETQHQENMSVQCIPP